MQLVYETKQLRMKKAKFLKVGTKQHQLEHCHIKLGSLMKIMDQQRSLRPCVFVSSCCLSANTLASYRVSFLVHLVYSQLSCKSKSIKLLTNFRVSVYHITLTNSSVSYNPDKLQTPVYHIILTNSSVSYNLTKLKQTKKQLVQCKYF